MIDIEILRKMYFQNDLPCPYQTKSGYELQINPIKVKDWDIFESSLNVLQFDKNSINDIEIIKMSYLDFLYDVIFTNDEEGYNQFSLGNIFLYSMNEKYISKGKNNGKNNIVLLDEKENIKGFISAKEFDEISKIILYQNLIKYDDKYMSQDIKEAIQEYYKIQNKMTNSVEPSLEKKKAFVISKTGILMKDINEMTYRTFGQVYDSCVETDIYFGKKIIQASYKYQVDQDVPYPLYEKEEDILDKVFGVDENTFTNKVNQVNG